jgi:PhnB protein
MKEINVYLSFDGNCREAMTFYAEAMGAEVPMMMTFKDMPNCPAEASDRIMHTLLRKGTAALMASDIMPGMEFHPGNNVTVAVQDESIEEQERVFNAIAAGGTVRMPLQDMFWGARFGMLTDKFGIHWMFNFEKP